MARAIDADKAIEVAQIKYNDWNLAMAAADGQREINLCFKKQELFKAVKAVLECVPTLTPPNEPLTLEDAKKERYIWFTPLNDWAKVTSFGVLFFGSEELMSWETLCEEWGYRFKTYRRPPEGEDNEKTNT